MLKNSKDMYCINLDNYVCVTDLPLCRRQLKDVGNGSSRQTTNNDLVIKSKFLLFLSSFIKSLRASAQSDLFHPVSKPTGAAFDRHGASSRM